ncbi:hypothetical protein [Larkinella rosea]|uniref:Uncharacterized protein n=1 Tax=Larkinella rosea TaxID=2025312 RepID=A0A3P1C3U9_9BACT|nr:hypothetical protein [Larkinella rosea]RRB07783.1 hypothetical protein EHT25_08410 [Larkinella rosea]
MKARSLAAVSVTATVLLALPLIPHSPLTDDTAFLSTFYGAQPPTIVIQQCDWFSQIDREPFPRLNQENLSDIRVAQTPTSSLNTAVFRDLWLIARLYPVYQTGATISWLFML